jgi:hypothetical protein
LIGKAGPSIALFFLMCLGWLLPSAWAARLEVERRGAFVVRSPREGEGNKPSANCGLVPPSPQRGEGARRAGEGWMRKTNPTRSVRVGRASAIAFWGLETLQPDLKRASVRPRE